MHDERCTDATFVVFAFVLSVGNVAQVRPTFAVAAGPAADTAPFLVIVHRVLVALDTEEARLLGAAIVGDEDQQRVVEFADLFQMVDDAADVLVESIDDGGKQGHLEVHVIALFV